MSTPGSTTETERQQASPASASAWRRGDVPWVLALGVAGAFINLHAPTVFFDSQIMLGGALVVFALLRFGWWGLLAGVLAMGGTALRWGHPFELIIGMLHSTWLLVFLQRFNGGWRNNDNGAAVVAAAGFWLLAGVWLEIALFHLVFGVPAREALALGLKECVVGIINASLGLLLFLLTRMAAARRGEAAISARGATFAFTLTVATLPSVLMVAVLSGQLRAAKLNSQLNALRYAGSRVADAYLSGRTQEPLPLEAGMACELLAGGQTLWSSDPEFFNEVDASHVVDPSRIPGRDDLAILKPREGGPVIKADRDSYWQAVFELPGRNGPLTVRVTQQAAVLINQIDQGMLVPAFSVLLSLLVLGVAASALASRAVGRRFDDILRPASGDPVRTTGIRELDDVMELAGGTREAREALQASETRYRNFFNLPLVGTAITSRTQGWVEVNDQTCEILGYPREELFRKTWADITYPDDLAADEAQFERMLRREIDGYQLEKRFIRKDGRVVHVLLAGGCGPIGDRTPESFYVNIVDISNRKQLEAELAAAAEREKMAEQTQREVIEHKLKTSLNAAAVAHEINQPLSQLLLRARLDLEKESGVGKETLRALIEDAERVVTTIEKMRVLLRNVATVQEPVDVAQVVRSALHQLKQPLRAARVTVAHTGPDNSCVVLGDDVQLQMIVINLVRNAIEAIAESQTARREISIECLPHDGTVELVIGDSGPGWPGGSIDDALLRTTKRGGAGIGLYVVKTALENHRGDITIGRSPLGGAEFRVTFPRVSEPVQTE